MLRLFARTVQERIAPFAQFTTQTQLKTPTPKQTSHEKYKSDERAVNAESAKWADNVVQTIKVGGGLGLSIALLDLFVEEPKRSPMYIASHIIDYTCKGLAAGVVVLLPTPHKIAAVSAVGLFYATVDDNVEAQTSETQKKQVRR